MWSPEGRAIMELTKEFAKAQMMQEPWTRERAGDFFAKIEAMLSGPSASGSGTETTCESTGREKGEDD